MALLSPLHVACIHFATPEEQRRDPRYLACGAAPGQPCQWARRHDGWQDPAFHTERLEAAAAAQGATSSPLTPDQFREDVLETGLV